MLEFLNQNAGGIMVIFTGVVTLSTFLYAILTALLVAETSRMRQAQTEPRGEVIIKPRE
jgi:ABC-type Na+ efflux pump permease subunit